MKKTTALPWCWLSVAVILIDQLTKYYAVKLLSLYQPHPIFPGLNFTLSYNTGAAFGLLGQKATLAHFLFTAIALIMSAVLLYALYRTAPHRRWFSAALALILGGALGNVLDRLGHGYVIDFIDFYYKNWHFATFNLADSAITVGAILLLIDALFGSTHSKEKRS